MMLRSVLGFGVGGGHHPRQMEWDMRKHLARLALSFAVGTLSAAQASPVVIENGSGILIGMDGIVVDSISYNVSFVPGDCIVVFSPCTSASDFTFTNVESAISAGIALASAINDSSYDFSTPTLVSGSVEGRMFLLIPMHIGPMVFSFLFFRPIETKSNVITPLTLIKTSSGI